jgi:hypothetical protein
MRSLAVRPSPAVQARALAERVRRLNPDLDPRAGTARAALLLLAGLYHEHNVVKLARFTGLEVDFVARCARRLVDNGVWRGGETICAWNEIPVGEPAFWADVAVAEGKLCRRMDDEGRAQWAPGGHWWKSFDLVVAAPLDQSVLYHSPPPSVFEADAQTEEAGSQATVESAVGVETSDRTPDDSPDLSDDKDASPSDSVPQEESSRTGADSSDLFPGAVWL